MVASQIRASARESLSGKWGKAALLTLTYVIIVKVKPSQKNFHLLPIIKLSLIATISLPDILGLSE